MTLEDRDKPDAAMIALLHNRDGMPTTVTLRDGRELMVWNIAWGYDIGDDEAHITTNCSPSVADLPLDFFYTDEVVEIRAFESGAVLLRPEQ